jgi:hypothetical protein
MGNHGLELALPNTQFWIRKKIAAEDSAVLGRISFSANGSGHACMVGDARIFCSHGNEVDDWSVVDQELLAKLSAAINADRFYPPSNYKPNAGTRLFGDVMNTIKQQYPFVDLLKPETVAVVPIL